MDEEKKAIKDILGQYAVCCNSGDFETWLSLWADNGVQLPPGAPAKIGKKEISSIMKPHFDEFHLNIAIKSIDDIRVFGDMGLTRCTYTLKLIPKAGGQPIDAMPDGKALTLYEKQSDGSWKIAYDCFNSNVSPT